MGHHAKFRADGRLQLADPGVGEHERCCRMLTSMACYDQLNLPNLASAELLSRSVQVTEERHRDKFVAKGSEMDDQHLYMGSQLGRGQVCVCPLLQEWVSEELRKESAVLKERRKAREERTLTKPGKGPAAAGP